ncbi:hypothetical protein B0H11DRAFT_2349563 [Mycena galericulata]|nr:hypothetical protein B0H11DRAFT_2349563 [Mycena galericulata]
MRAGQRSSVERASFGLPSIPFYNLNRPKLVAGHAACRPYPLYNGWRQLRGLFQYKTEIHLDVGFQGPNLQYAAQDREYTPEVKELREWSPTGEGVALGGFAEERDFELEAAVLMEDAKTRARRAGEMAWTMYAVHAKVDAKRTILAAVFVGSVAVRKDEADDSSRGHVKLKGIHEDASRVHPTFGIDGDMVVNLESETAITLLGLGIAGTNACAYRENGAPE